ncbi:MULTISPECIES: antitoxin Xre/MbcA/ParS toxin-binding domain-containing protein [Sphingomonas]|uniref:antitoxin Xre/MbcA/ParS toxin-binding domain-containing protein n=1 Tax=Sphingomonas TaxID=13687 RepID=UPI0025E8AB49|nr:MULTISPECIES: antitoxin Xre/MbcA/ParS toxin-binding domain-containing protein [Sphingomonas]HJO66469.1 antitoxin Xre/MbcA/ParS toxin-binding domain-containing protein [Sphingomonas sanguinis]
MIAAFLDDIRDHDMIAPRRMAERLRLPLTRLAKLAQINRNTMAAKPGSPAVQARLGEIARIIARAAELSGDEGRAIIWFRHQPLPGFGKTPEQLVEEGHAALVLSDLDRMAEGVYS